MWNVGPIARPSINAEAAHRFAITAISSMLSLDSIDYSRD